MPMEPTAKPYVHTSINAVDAVAFDPEGRYEADLYDRYATFEQARDAALSSIELMLDEGDCNGRNQREELQLMLGLLDPARTFSDLEGLPDYPGFLERL